MNPSRDDLTIQRYVDGELSEAEAAAFAAQLSEIDLPAVNDLYNRTYVQGAGAVDATIAPLPASSVTRQSAASASEREKLSAGATCLTPPV